MIACLRNTGLFAVLLLCFIRVKGQEQELTHISSDINHNSGYLPAFFKKEHVKGSPYLAEGWLRGNALLTDQRRLPEPGHNLFFNFDKMNNRLYVTDGISKIWNYPSDSVVNFSLADSSTILSFEKVDLISRNRFLQVLVRSEKGYSVYREWVTKLLLSNFRDEGYYTTGQKYDEYVDLYNYYIIYPGHRSFRQLELKLHVIRKALRSESARLDSFFMKQKSGPVDMNTFVLFMQYLNERNGY